MSNGEEGYLNWGAFIAIFFYGRLFCNLLGVPAGHWIQAQRLSEQLYFRIFTLLPIGALKAH